MFPELGKGNGLVMSDAHLTEFKPKIDQPRLDFLMWLLTGKENNFAWAAINGDLFDNMVLGNIQQEMWRVYNSGWRPFFDALGKIYTVRIYGNHDRAKLNFLLSPPWKKETNMASFNRYGRALHIFHGDQHHPSKFIQALNKGVGKVLLKPVYYGADSMVKNSYLGILLQVWFENFEIRNNVKLAKGIHPDHVYFVGHTHQGRGWPNLYETGYSNRLRFCWGEFDDAGYHFYKGWLDELLCNIPNKPKPVHEWLAPAGISARSALEAMNERPVFRR